MVAAEELSFILFYLFFYHDVSCQWHELEGLDGGGDTNVSCQVKFWLFVSRQLNFRPFVSCQLIDW